MKLLVIGTQLSGKTTLARYLREHTHVIVSEVDEEIVRENGGTWPEDNVYKDTVLIPRIYERIASMESVIFFANYFAPVSQVEIFRSQGFSVANLRLGRDEMLRRNIHRMQHEGYEDATPWIDGQITNHNELRRLGLVDIEVDATLPTAEIAHALMQFAAKSQT